MARFAKVTGVVTCSAALVVGYLTNNPNLVEYKVRTSPQFMERVLAKWEGCHQTPYNDTGGLPTNGIGHLCVNGDGSNKLLTIEEVARFLNKDLWVAEKCVNQYFAGRDMPQEKFEAITSFVFNVGCSKAIGIKTRTQIRKLALLHNYDSMCNELYKWSKGRNLKGELVTIKGLYNRRVDEVKWCLTGNI